MRLENILMQTVNANHNSAGSSWFYTTVCCFFVFGLDQGLLAFSPQTVPKVETLWYSWTRINEADVKAP